MNKLTDEAVQKLTAVKHHVLAEPARAYMGEWIIKLDADYLLLEDFIASEKDDHPDFNTLPSCNTAACIAGWVCLLSGETERVYGERAAKILGLDDEQGDRLFILPTMYQAQCGRCCWPKEFADRLAETKQGTKEYAQVVADRIDKFIETGGAV